MESKKRQFGDRVDAKLCRDVLGMNQICIDLKPRRSLGELYINERVDVTNLVNYINKQKEQGNIENKITYFHAFVTAIAKTIYNRPLLNRFVANRHTYEHNDVSISFVMKKEFSDEAEELMVIINVLENDNLFTISKNIYDKVNNVRDKKDKGKGANDAIKIVSKLPNILRVPLVGIIKYLDKIGHLPKFLKEDNLYYSSMVVSNIGTLECSGIYHNVTDFGTCSGIITIGEIKKDESNKKEIKYYCDLGVTIDERIADGFYMIKSLKLIEYLLLNPELLEGSANEKIEIKEK